MMTYVYCCWMVRRVVDWKLCGLGVRVVYPVRVCFLGGPGVGVETVVSVHVQACTRQSGAICTSRVL